MPRKTPLEIRVRQCGFSFNEAAARCRGKHAQDGLVAAALTLLQ